MNTPEAIQQVLAHIETQAKRAGPDAAYQDLVVASALPLTALAALGTLNRLDGPDRDALPSLLLEDRRGQAQIEFCPFGPLALITSDGEMDTDPPAQTLLDAGFQPLFQSDMDEAGDWHGTPLTRWLFPRRLAAALALFDALKDVSKR